MSSKCLLILAICLLSTPSQSSGQALDLSNPQPEHELLGRFAGTWEYEKRSTPTDGSASEKVGSGKIKTEMLGSYFAICQWSGDVYGTKFKAVQTLGYDVSKQEYMGSWVDSLMSHQWQYSGSMDSKAKEVLIVEASGPGPGGGTATFRERYEFKSADSIVIVAQMQQGTEWSTFMTTHLTRKKQDD